MKRLYLFFSLAMMVCAVRAQTIIQSSSIVEYDIIDTVTTPTSPRSSIRYERSTGYLFVYNHTSGEWESYSSGGGGGSPSGAASGDLDGDYPDPTVIAWNGIQIPLGTPETGEIPKYDGAAWSWDVDEGLYEGSGTIPSGTTAQTSSGAGLNFVFDTVTVIGHGLHIDTDGEIEISSADLDMGSNKITDLADPTSDQDAATKAYVDANGGGAANENYYTGKWWQPQSLADSYGLSVDFSERTTLDAGTTRRNEFPNLAYNPITNRLVATYRHSPTHVFSQSGVVVWTYSDDLGQTWAAVDTLFNDGASGGDGVNNSVMWDEDTQKWFAVVEYATGSTSPNDSSDVIFYTSTTGTSWTAIDTITKAQVEAIGDYCGIGFANDLVRAANGNLLFPFYTRFEGDCTTLGRAIHVAVSTDDGESWTYNVIDDTNTGRLLNEVTIIRKPSGTLLAIARSENGDLYRYESTDHGSTWDGGTDITPTGYYQTKPVLLVLSGERLLIVNRTSGDYSPQYSLSSDWGDSWNTPLDLPDIPSGLEGFFYGDFEPLGQNVAAFAYTQALDFSANQSNAYFRLVYGGAASVNGTLSGLTKSEAAVSSSAVDIDWQYRPLKTSRQIIQPVSDATYTFSNPTDGGRYTILFSGDTDSVTINLPNNVFSLDSTSLSGNYAGSFMLDCTYVEDESNYYCSSTGVLGTPSGGFAPDDISGLYLWIDASQETEYADAATVDTLHDWSGNGRHFTGATSNEPVFEETSSYHGGPTFTFDGTQYAEHVTNTEWSFLHNDPHTIIIVMEIDPTNGTDTLGYIMGNNRSSISNTGFYLTWEDRKITNSAAGLPANDQVRHGIANGSGSAFTSPSINWSSDDAFPPSTYHLLIIEGDPDSGTAADRSNMYVDSGSAIANNIYTGTPSATVSTYEMQIGCAGDGFRPMAGEISEVIIYDKVINSAERSQLITYYNNKY